MTPQELATEATRARNAGGRLDLERLRGTKMPPGFPRGKLRCVNPHNGMNVYSYNPALVLAWLKANQLIED